MIIKDKSTTKRSPTVLVILDGYGYRKEKKYNAIAQAKKPFIDKLFQEYPHALLKASGSAVGLPANTIGNSEVGHLTIGAGRIIKQDIVKINEKIENKSFFKNQLLVGNLEKLAKSDKALHLIGLLSDASVHSHLTHLFAYLKAAKEQKVDNIYLHLFLDGRDVPPKSAKKYLTLVENQIEKIGIGKIASLSGRYYGMDRNQNWVKTKKAYNVMTEKEPHLFKNWQTMLEHYYTQGITDEFIPPTQFNGNGIIKNGDGIIFFNFRPDRARKLASAFVAQKFDHFPTRNIKLAFFITPTDYHSKKFKTIVLFPSKPIQNTLKDILKKNNKSFFSIAETEKYAHVTYFFAGGKEERYPNETRILIPSIPTKNYVNIPEMSAKEITNAVLESLKKSPQDFYLINYANADMVGHSGNLEATIKAIECLDKELKRLYEILIDKLNGTLYVTADHGNAEDMFDSKHNQPKTSHTINPVPFIMIRRDLQNLSSKLPLNQLSDIAPFILSNFKVHSL